MAATSVLMGLSLVSAYNQSEAAKAQGDYQRSMGRTNAMIADEQAADAKARGEHEALIQGGKTRVLMGAQRAAQAASGLDINSGSAADVRAETQFLGERDAQTIKNNAWREAWGYQAQARDSLSQGNMAYIAGQNESRNTLLTGGINAASFAQRGMKGVDKTVDNRAGSTRSGNGSGPRVRPSNDY